MSDHSADNGIIPAAKSGAKKIDYSGNPKIGFVVFHYVKFPLLITIFKIELV